jgi:hypothetical protein
MISSLRILQLALVGGIVFLAANGIDGWGWLVFILFLTLDRNE